MSNYSKHEEAREAELTEGETPSYKPRTPLGHKLLEIRKRIVESGEPLLGMEDIERELKNRRGGVE